MDVTMTAKLKIDPTPEQVVPFKETLVADRQACHDVSAVVFETKNLSKFSLQKATYAKLRETYQLKSQMAISVLGTVIATYKSAQSNGHDWSLVHFKRPELDLVWNRDDSLTKDKFSVNTLSGRIKVAYTKQGMEDFFDGTWSFGTAKLVFKHHKWFLHLPMTKELPDLDESQFNNVVGIDLGVNFIATAYDSKGKTLFFSGKQVKHKRAQYLKTRKE